MSKDKNRDYTPFNKFIDGAIRNGEITFEMNDIQLNEALYNLGIRRKKFPMKIQEGFMLQMFTPHKNQLSYVKERLEHRKPKQERLGFERPYSYDKNNRVRVTKGHSILFIIKHIRRSTFTKEVF